MTLIIEQKLALYQYLSTQYINGENFVLIALVKQLREELNK